jgi:hypothetical protein
MERLAQQLNPAATGDIFNANETGAKRTGTRDGRRDCGGGVVLRMNLNWNPL